MRTMQLAATALAAALGLTGCDSPREPTGVPSEAAASPTEQVAAAATPPASYAQCVSCHSVKPGVNGVGPSLHGVVGTKAASVPGYSYSPALQNAGLTWDEATLDKWLTAPMTMVPGTKMVFPGIPDPARRKEVIDYLKTLK